LASACVFLRSGSESLPLKVPELTSLRRNACYQILVVPISLGSAL
jgi:hypothetical protein